MVNIVETDDSKFGTDALQSDAPVLVFFKSEWCPVCKSITSTVELVSDKYTDKVKFVKIDIAKNHKISAQYRVLAIPSLIFFKNGNEVSRHTGHITENDLISFIDKNL